MVPQARARAAQRFGGRAAGASTSARRASGHAADSDGMEMEGPPVAEGPRVGRSAKRRRASPQPGPDAYGAAAQG